MMSIQIRYGTFETNSSSVHAFAFIDDDAYDEWVQGAYIDLGKATDDNNIYFDELDYINLDISDFSEKPFCDISNDMISHNGVGRVRKELYQESYYKHPDDCLLEAGIFPYEACADEATGKPSSEWAKRCGGLNCLRVEPVNGGYNIYANWYAW